MINLFKEDPRTSVDDTIDAVRALGATIKRRAGLHYAGETFDALSWRELADTGFWRIPISQAWDGLGGTWSDLAEGFCELAATADDLGFLLSMIAHAGLLRAISEFGTDYQRAHFLPDMIDGGIGATALTEIQGGSDVARIQTTATPTSSGYVLDGAKIHITNAPMADVALVLGRIPALGTRDITLFLLPLHDLPVDRGPSESLMGLRTSPTGSLLMNGLPLKETAVLGLPGAGLDLLYKIIDFDRVLYGLIASSFLRPQLDQALDFATQRKSFGVPAIDHQYVQGRLTDVKIIIETTRAVSWAALDALLAGAEDASLQCSIAKMVGAEGLASAAQHLMLLSGHAGYERGALTKLVQDAIGTLIAGGTSEMQRKNMLNQMVRAHRRKAIR